MSVRDFFRHLRSLLWKNYLLKRRNWGSTLSEILAPVIVLFLMVAIRDAISVDKKDTTLFPASTLNITALASNIRSTREGGLKLAFAPTDAAPLMEDFLNTFPPFRESTMLFNTETDLENYVTSEAYGSSVSNPYLYGAIVMSKSATVNDPTWKYKIRLNSSLSFTTTIDTSSTTPQLNNIQNVYDDTWVILRDKGFVFFQQFVDNWIIHQSSGAQIGARHLNMVPFPTPAYVKDLFADSVAGVIGLFMAIIFLWPVTRIVKSIVEEKEYRIKEGMKMMGLSDTALWLSWVITYIVIFIISSIFITIISSFNLFPKSNKFLIFWFFFQFQMAAFSFCYFLSSFFSRSRVGTTVAAVVFLVSYFPYFGFSDDTSSGAKTLASLFPTIGLGLGSVYIFKMESYQLGVQMNTQSTMLDNYSYSTAGALFFIDFWFWLLLGLYFDKIIQGDWGTALPWYFPCLPSHWPCLSRRKKRGPASAPSSSAPGSPPDYELHQVASSSIPIQSTNPNIETVPESMRSSQAISIRGLRKVFPGQDGQPPLVAVQDMNFDLYENQILSLLGHNGAGKTTTIAMLTGMTPPTQGQVTMLGYDLSEDLNEIRKHIGVCPQHNILFDQLTVYEHLELYASIKLIPSEQVQQQIDIIVQQVGLQEKMNARSGTLSGGMKRKLSVAIALIGDSKIVFLDEPTSGMDPYSRRATWDLLKQKKHGRVMILTTHFMDEADQLGDRIAIMAKGDIKCCGSSLFLKSRYGVGYTLTITKTENARDDQIQSLIMSHVPSAQSLTRIAGELSYQLSFAVAPQLPTLFEQFDKLQNYLGIINYGISVTTLEEVFLKVGEEGHAEESSYPGSSAVVAPATTTAAAATAGPVTTVVNTGSVSPRSNSTGSRTPAKSTVNQRNSRNNSNNTFATFVHNGSTNQTNNNNNNNNNNAASISPRNINNSNTSEPVHKESSVDVTPELDISLASIPLNTHPRRIFQRHIWALLVKRFHNARRDKKVWTWTILYPFLIILIGVGFTKLIRPANPPEKILDRTLFNIPNYVPYVNTTDTIPIATNVFTTVNAATSTFIGVNNIMTNSTDYFSQYLLDSRNDYKQSKYGAFMYEPNYGYNTTTNTIIINDESYVYFNTTAKYGLPMYLNLLNNAVYRYIMGNNTANIQVSTHPFPRTASQQTLVSTSASILISIGFAFVPASFVAFTVKEEADKAKHLQFISGISPLAYWTAHYIWDLFNYIIPACLCMLVLKIWNIDQTIGENAGATFLGIMLHGFSIIPFTYLCSFLFDNSSTAQNTMLIIYILAGAGLLIASVVMDIIESTQDINRSLKYIYRFLPSYTFGEVISNLFTRKSATVWGSARTVWDYDIVGIPMIYMAVLSIGFFLLTLLVEKIRATPEIWLKLSGKESSATAVNQDTVQQQQQEEDEDVINERQRLLNMESSNQSKDMISILGLRKVYPGRLGAKPKIALHNLHLGIPEGQCFGYLGINGAGKTTTMKCLTGDILPTSGEAYLNGMSIRSQQHELRRLLGYCPQFDALVDTLTAREHLYLYARIKGVEENILFDYVEKLISRLGLQAGIADRPAGGYSGGNKRKLSLGIALIGNPSIMFLDEPSTGMDPGSRRFMWDLIASTMKGRSVVLTTHSMEECEALCSRIGIMVGGRLKCLGSSQHIKTRHGSGYQVDINVAVESVQEDVKAFFHAIYPDSKLIEWHGNNMKFRVAKSQGGNAITIASIFRIMEANKDKYRIAEYSVSETTLEQIFIHFAKQQEEETTPISGILQ